MAKGKNRFSGQPRKSESDTSAQKPHNYALPDDYPIIMASGNSPYDPVDSVAVSDDEFDGLVGINAPVQPDESFYELPDRSETVILGEQAGAVWNPEEFRYNLNDDDSVIAADMPEASDGEIGLAYEVNNDDTVIFNPESTVLPVLADAEDAGYSLPDESDMIIGITEKDEPDAVSTEPDNTEELVDINGLVLSKNQANAPADVASQPNQTTEAATEQSDASALEKTQVIETSVTDENQDTVDSSENFVSGDEDEKNSDKKQKNMRLIISASVAVLVICVALMAVFKFPIDFASIFTGTDNENNSSLPNGTASVIPTEEPTQYPTFSSIPSGAETFIFPVGFKIQNVNIGGKSYNDALKALADTQKSLLRPFEITVEHKNRKTTLDQHSFEYSFDTKQVLDVAYLDCKGAVPANQGTTESPADTSASSPSTSSYTQAREYKISYKLIEDSIPDAVDAAAKAIDIPVKEPRVTQFNPTASEFKDRFKFAGGTDGLAIDKDQVKTAITSFLNTSSSSITIEAAAKTVKPKNNVDNIKDNIVKLSTFSTTSTNTADGNHNMNLGMQAANGQIIEPNGIFSFNNSTGNSNLASNGYRLAHVISGGRITDGIGGGLCQAATTIYNAAIRANMEIVERHPHKWSSTYCYAGLDATIDYPGLDMRVRNTTKYQIFIEAYMVGTKLTCNIYGWQDPSFDEIRTFSNGYNIEWGDGYNTTAYRAYYKKGVFVKKQDLPSSWYSLDGGYVQPNDPGTIIPLYEEDEKPTDAPTQAPTTKPPVTTVPPKTTIPQPTTKKPTTAAPTTAPPTTAAPTTVTRTTEPAEN